MENNVVVLNDELGTMTLGFLKMGFNVVSTYVTEKRTEEICKHNFGENVILSNIIDINENELPDVQVIVGKLMIRNFSIAVKSKKEERDNGYFQKYRDIIYAKKPKFFVFESCKLFVRTEKFKKLKYEMENCGYKLLYNIMDTDRETEIPVRESKLYIIGYLNVRKITLLENDYKFYGIQEIFRDDYLEKDDWYYNINQQKIEFKDIGKKLFFYCWNGNRYVASETINLNGIKVPLISYYGKIRKITHQEIARLKGIPDDYYLDSKNKSWLYKKLMASSNMLIIEQIAKSIRYYMEANTVRNQQLSNGVKFENLLREYFRKKDCIIQESGETDIYTDFVISDESKKIYIESKFYTDNIAIESKIIRICERIKINKKDLEGIYILAIGNIVRKEVKQECKEKYGIYIWDVENILWIFDTDDNIRNEFVSLLSYTIDDIEPEKPEKFLFDIENKIDSAINLMCKLKQIKSGKEYFTEYQDICVEILRYILADYLTLWKEQEESNNGLYRFDLCCKIKHGASQEFFDTIRNFFNTKYIVFEFKNYENKISQNEIYTTEKYLYDTALRKVAIIISRKGANDNALIAAKGCLRENGKLIICWSDNDLIRLMEIKDKGEKTVAEQLSNDLDELLIKLEK